MKKLLLLSLAVLFCTNTFAQSTTYNYYFSNNLHEHSGAGPDLLSGCTGTYNMETLPVGASKNVYYFNRGCGLFFNDAAGFLAAGNYTVELYFKLDTVSGYKKILDFDSLGQDKGLYNYNGGLALYSHFSSTSSSYFADSQYVYLAITRDAATKQMYLYVNDSTVGSYDDTGSEYVYDTNKLFIFFHDDHGTGGEQTSGAVTMIRISNYAMDSTAIKNDYTNLSSTLSVAHAQVKNDVLIYPNPATDYVQVKVSAKCTYTLSDMTGKEIMANILQQGANNINLATVMPGMYFMKITTADTESKMYKIVKE